VKLVAISAGESPSSKTTALVAPVVADHAGELIELSALSADGLLGRTQDPAVAAAVASASAADVLVVATPIYRATYTGAMKAFFDRFPPCALSRTVVVLVGTALAPEHYLALDTGCRALIASLEGWTAPTVVYATSTDFVDGEPTDDITTKLRLAVEGAEALARVIRVATEED
jgi:FMN reductase